MLTLIGHSSDETVGEVVSKLLLYRRAGYLQFGAVGFVEKLGALSR